MAMKIILVSNLYGRNAKGGAENVVRAEAEALKTAGHEVAVVHGLYGREEPSAEYEGVRTIGYRPAQVFGYPELAKHSAAGRLGWHIVDLFNGRSARQLAEIIRAERPDIVHTHNLMGLGFLIPARIKTLKIKHVHTVHDVQLLHPSGLLTADRGVAAHGLAQSIYIRIVRRLFGSPSAVVFPSHFLLAAHQKAGFFARSGLELLRNPASIAPAPPVFGDGPPIFLFAGQLEGHKGILFLLEAWRRWSGRKDAVLEVAGSGSLQKRVEDIAAGRPDVRLLGRLDRPGLEQAYRRAAYVILPSLVIENAPTVIIEGFAYGVPAVAAAAGGVPELVEDGLSGFLFQPGDEAGLLRALDAARAALPQRSRLSEAVRSRAGKMEISEHIRRLLEIYRS